MRKVIKSIGLNERRSLTLREKAVELLIKSQRPIKEVDLVNFMIDELTERIDIDEMGFYLKEDEEQKQ